MSALLGFVMKSQHPVLWCTKFRTFTTTVMIFVSFSIFKTEFSSLHFGFPEFA